MEPAPHTIDQLVQQLQDMRTRREGRGRRRARETADPAKITRGCIYR
jgi:transposase